MRRAKQHDEEFTKLPCVRRLAGDTKRSTPPAELEAALKELASHAPRWAATPFSARAALARECAARALDVAEEVTATAVAYKGAYEARAARCFAASARHITTLPMLTVDSSNTM